MITAFDKGYVDSKITDYMTKDVITEAVWFANRSVPGTRFVFDDYPKYDMTLIERILSFYQFKTREQGNNKLLMEHHG